MLAAFSYDASAKDLLITLDVADESITLTSSGGGNYNFTTNETFIGPTGVPGLTVNGSSDLTISDVLDLATIRIQDSALGTSVAFGTSRGAYVDALSIVLDDATTGDIVFNDATTLNQPLAAETKGNITQVGAITAGSTATFKAGASSAITLNNTSNNFSVAVSVVQAATAKITSAGSLSLGSLTAAEVTVTFNGTLTQQAGTSIEATDLIVTNNATAAGAVTLANAGNDVDNVSIKNTAGAVTFRDADDLEIGVSSVPTIGISAGGAVTLTAGGNVTQSLAVIGTSLDVSTASGSITLLDPTNSVNTLKASSVTGGDITYNNAGGLQVTGLTTGSGRQVNLTAGSDITQNLLSTAKITTGTLTATATSGNISLQNPLNNVSSISLTASVGSVDYTDLDDVGIVLLAAGSTLSPKNISITSLNGGITQSGVISGNALVAAAANAITLNTVANSVASLSVTSVAGNVDFKNSRALNVVAASTNGSVSLAVTIGALSQSGAIKASTLALDTGSGAVTLNESTNDIDTLVITNASGAVAYRDADDLLLGSIAIVSTGSLAVIARGAVGQTGVVQSPTLSVTNIGVSGDVSLADYNNQVTTLAVVNSVGAVSFKNQLAITLAGIAAGGAVVIEATEGVTQTGKLSGTSLTVTNGTLGNIVLDTFANDFADISATNQGRNVRYKGAGGFQVGAIDAGSSGSVTLTSSGAIAQSGAITAGDLLVTNTGSGTVTLLATNSVTRLGVANGGGNVAFRNGVGVEVGSAGIGITAGAVVSLYAGGNVTQANPILAGSLLIENSAGVVNLANSSNAVSNLSVSNSSRNVTFVNSTALVIGGVAGATVGLDGAGVALTAASISQASSGVTSAIVDSISAVTLTLATVPAGTIALGNTLNDVGTMTVPSATNVAYADANDLIIAGIIASGSVTLTAGSDGFSSGDLSQTGVIKANALSVGNNSFSGDVVLNLLNEVSTFSAVNASGDVSFKNDKSLSITGIVSGGTISITTTNDTISQTAAISAIDLLLDAGTGDVTLTDAANSVGFLAVAAAGDLKYVNDTALVIDGLAVTSAEITHKGDLAQIGPLSVTGPLTTVNAAGSGDVTLNDSANSVASVKITNAGGNVAFAAGGGYQVLGVTSKSDISLDASGSITQGTFAANAITGVNLVVTVSGNVSLDNAANDVDNLTVSGVATTTILVFVDKDDLNVGIATAGGLTVDTATITAGDAITQSESILASTALTVTSTAGDITLADPNNLTDAAAFKAAAGDVAYTNTSALSIGVGGLGISSGGRITLDAFLLSQTNTIAGANLVVTSTNGVDLSTVTNSVGALTMVNSSGDVAYKNLGGLVVGVTGEADGITTSGDVTLTTEGVVSQILPIKAAALGVVNSAGAVTLDDANNDIDNLSIANGARAITFVDANDVIIGGVIGATVGLQGSTVTLTAGGDVTQDSSATDHVVATTLAGTAAGKVVLDNTNNKIGTVKVSAGGVVTIVDGSGDLVLDGVTATGTITLDSSGKITQTQALTGGDLVVTTTGGAVALTDPGNNLISLEASTNGGNLTFVEVDTIKLNAIDTAGGNLSITAGDSITVSGPQSSGAGNLSLVSGGAVAVKNTVTATGAGNILIQATGGSVTSTAGSTISSASDATITAFASVSLAGDVQAGPTATADVLAITAGGGSITLIGAVDAAVANFDAQSGIKATGKVEISDVLSVTNAASGNITIDNVANDIVEFGATNQAAGGKVVFQTSGDVTIDASGQGIATSNGIIEFTSGGDILLAARVTSGTEKTSISSAGHISQTTDAPITAATLRVFNASTTAGDISLAVADNDVNVLIGGNSSSGGKLSFDDVDDITLGNVPEGIATSDGDITVTTGTAMVLANVVDSGTGNVSLNMAAGVSSGGPLGLVLANGLNVVNIAVPAENTTGDIALENFNSVSKFSAVNATPGSGNVFFYNTQDVDVAGIATAFSARLTVLGSVTDSTLGFGVQADNLTVSAAGAVTLDGASNDVNSLAIQSRGAGSAIVYNDATGVTVGIGSTSIQGVRANNGDVTLTAGGAIAINAEIFAGQSVAEGILTTLSSSGGISQTSTVALTSDRLEIINSTADIVSLTSQFNDVKYFKAANAGGIDYTDANDFETGFAQLSAGTIGTAITSLGEVKLAATGPGAVLRVVEGIKAGALSLRGGPDVADAASVGSVEFVTTSTTDNPAAGAAFAGTLRDMIRLANTNAATIEYNGSRRAAPMAMVFDEANYDIDDISLNAALPSIAKPVTVAGARSFEDRVGLVRDFTPTNNAVVNGLAFGRGSDGSAVSGMAIHGFTTGAGIQISSSLNAVTNTWLGLTRTGEIPVNEIDEPIKNLVGLDINGAFASSNTIGSTIVDSAAVNVIGNTSSAGILIRNGATANSVFGNSIGVDAAGVTHANGGDGIRIESSSGNRIGTSLATNADGIPGASNIIQNSTGAGISIRNSLTATLAFGNAVENNSISDNAAGIVVQSSSNQRIGGTSLRQGNVISNHSASGVAVISSTGIQVSGNGLLDNANGLRLTRSTGALVTGNTVTASIEAGMILEAQTTGTRLSGNTVSTSTVDGIRISQSLGNLVLNNSIDGSNPIAMGMAEAGIRILNAAAGSLALGNVVAGNVVSGNATGVLIEGGSRHTIGGSLGANVITQNTDGIKIQSSTLLGASVANVIRGNSIGTNASVESGLGNTESGITVSNAVGTIIDSGNVIASNKTGIKLTSVSGAAVGSAAVNAGNTILDNAIGIEIGSSSTAWTSNVGIMGNTIAGSATGATGIRVSGSKTSNVVIGLRANASGAAAGRGNTISLPLVDGTGSGVVVDGAQSVTIQGNSIVGGARPIQILNAGNTGAVAPTINSAIYTSQSATTGRLVVSGTFARAGGGTVTIVNGVAQFSQSQSLSAGSTLTVNGVNYTVAAAIANTGNRQWRVTGGPSTLTKPGGGRVAATTGVATFSVSQTGKLSVGQSILVAGRSYAITSLSSNGRRATLAGSPTFFTSTFSFVPSAAGGYAFTTFSASALNQQYFVDLYLNDPFDGNGTGQAMRTFLGRQAVTVSPTSSGAFSITLTVPASSMPVGRYVTATATTMRAINGASAFSTSAVSNAKAAAFRAPGA